MDDAVPTTPVAGPRADRRPVDGACVPAGRIGGHERHVRHSRDEIRQMMMAAGLEILEERGLGVAVGDLTFKRVFDRIDSTRGVRLTNASVIRRVWENQAAFQDDVLAEVALAGDGHAEVAQLVEELAETIDSIDRSTVEGRLRGLSELARVGGEAGLRTLTTSRRWALWVGIWVLAVTSPASERGRRIRQALYDGYESSTEQWCGLYGALHSHLGVRLRSPYTLRQMVILTGALIEGDALRHGAGKGGGTVLRPTGPGGELQEWTLYSVGLEAMANQFLEIDPEWEGPEGAG